MKYRGDNFVIAGFAAFILVLVLLIGSVIGLAVYQDIGNEQTQVCTVKEKDRTSYQGESDMRLYTEECGVIQVGDILLQGQFDTANTYADIEVGKTYEFTTVGGRFPFFSLFPKIVGDVTEVQQ